MPDGGRRRPLIVPIFIPNQGCPHRCAFCRQEEITSQATGRIDQSFIATTIEQALASPLFDTSRKPQVAFYGGSFTRLPLERMAELLAPVSSYLGEGLFDSVRVSTRPDAIDEERLSLLKRFGVTTVELGAQSMDDKVLGLSRRGHRAEDTVRASRLLKERGFQLGIQLMPGLPGDSTAGWRKSIEEVIRLRPDMVRLYPTVVIKGTELARWYLEKRYRPLGLREAVKACQEGCIRFEDHGIPVIRLGLMATPALLEEGHILAGPWHNAFGQLVRSAVYHERLKPSLPAIGPAKQVGLRAPAGDIPFLRGYRNQGLRLLEKRLGARITAVLPDEALTRGTIGVDRQ